MADLLRHRPDRGRRRHLIVLGALMLCTWPACGKQAPTPATVTAAGPVTGAGTSKASTPSATPAAAASPDVATPPAAPAVAATTAPRADALTTAPEAAGDGPVVKHLEREGVTSLDDLFARERERAKKADKGVVVVFTADWCTPCRTIRHQLADSPVVRKAASQGVFLFIDVDTWRGPAHRLIEGADPGKLPLLVSVDDAGALIHQSYGTALGLLNEADLGENLGRLARGEAPVRPSYMDDDAKRRELAVADAKRKRAAAADVVPFEATVTKRAPLGDGQTRYTLRVVLRNAAAPRRWYTLPRPAGPAPTEPLTAPSWSLVRFAEHVRASYRHYETTPPLSLVPVAGWGSVTLDQLTVVVPDDVTALEVWQLKRVEVDGTRLSFEKKVAYALAIEDASAVTPVREFDTPVALDLTVGATHTIPLGTP